MRFIEDGYSFDELRELGCPDGLLMQYIFMSREWINKLIKQTHKDTKHD